MQLIQIILPLRDGQDAPYPASLYDEVRADLGAHFTGVTAHERSDHTMIFEVMVERLEREFWRLYRRELQETFRRELITIRAYRIDLL